jgi:hypothetical protein
MVDETYTRHIRRLEAKIASLQDEVTALTALNLITVPTHTHNDLYYLRGLESASGEYINTSAGAADASKPVLTGLATGQLHPSLIPATRVFVNSIYFRVAL